MSASFIYYVVVSPDPVSGIAFFNITINSLFLAFEFGFNGYGLLTQLSIVYYTSFNEETYQNETLTFSSNETVFLPTHVNISGLQPLTTYLFIVIVSNEGGQSTPASENVTTLPLR